MSLTQEEYDAFFMVRKIVGTRIAPERLTKSPAKSYLAIQLDDSSRKTVCRLYLMGAKKYIGTISVRKVETKSELRSVSDIMKFTPELTAIIAHYENLG